MNIGNVPFEKRDANNDILKHTRTTTHLNILNRFIVVDVNI